MDATSLAEKYFADLASDDREDNEQNRSCWLWFTCPANMRETVAPLIDRIALLRAAEGVLTTRYARLDLGGKESDITKLRNAVRLAGGNANEGEE